MELITKQALKPLLERGDFKVGEIKFTEFKEVAKDIYSTLIHTNPKGNELALPIPCRLYTNPICAPDEKPLVMLQTHRCGFSAQTNLAKFDPKEFDLAIKSVQSN
jgi:hypothetical protein